MNQYDLVASPMRTAFVNGSDEDELHAVDARCRTGSAGPGRYGGTQANTKGQPEDQGPEGGWLEKKEEIFAGKLTKPDSEDPDTVNHLNWYRRPGLSGPIPARARFARRASSTTRHLLAKTRTTKPRFDCNGPLSDNRGEGFLFMPQTQSQVVDHQLAELDG